MKIYGLPKIIFRKKISKTLFSWSNKNEFIFIAPTNMSSSMLLISSQSSPDKCIYTDQSSQTDESSHQQPTLISKASYRYGVTLTHPRKPRVSRKSKHTHYRNWYGYKEYFNILKQTALKSFFFFLNQNGSIFLFVLGQLASCEELSI